MLMLFWKYGLSIMFFQYAILTLTCIIIFFTDLFHRVIPDILTLTLIGVGIVFSFWNTLGILVALKGLALGGGLFLLIYAGYKWITKQEGLGKGDVKLMAMIGASLGIRLTFLTIFLSALIGMIVWLLTKYNRQFLLPFGSFIAIATFISLIAGDQIIKSYLELWS
jgi:leader peptidase (prepilin peptidase)/N-methyltransferase